VWPAGLISAVTIAASLLHFYRLYIKRDHRLKTLRSGLPVLLAAGSATLATGVYGTLYELNRTMVEVIMNTEKSLLYLTDWAMKCSAMMIFSLFSAIAAAVIWYIFMDKVRRIEIAEASWLFE
jgi:hypothetical protein